MNEQWKVRCVHKTLSDPKTLKPHPKNPNKHPEAQIERLAHIMAYQGWRYPIKVSLATGFITSGHGRLLAALKTGQTKVPIDFQEYESAEQEWADIVADNAIAEWAEFDRNIIKDQVLDFGPDFDLDVLGFNEIDFLNLNGLYDLPNVDTGEQQFRIEVKFANDMEMNDVKDDLLARGYIVKVL